MDEQGTALNDAEIAPSLDRALGLWGSHSSWFGLHGHLWMGPLASVQSQTELRQKFASASAFVERSDVRLPIGARASAIYSIAHRMGTWERKYRHYKLAATLASRVVGEDGNGAHGALLIRGHSYIRMAMLGRPWLLWSAKADFSNAVQLREAAGATDANVGEAKVALGLSLILTGRRSSGVEMLQNGVSLMRGNTTPSGLSFLANGLRKLEQGARFAGRRDLEEEARHEREELAVAIEAMDQTRSLDLG